MQSLPEEKLPETQQQSCMYDIGGKKTNPLITRLYIKQPVALEPKETGHWNCRNEVNLQKHSKYLILTFS